MVRVHHDEGVANHIGPEPCVEAGIDPVWLLLTLRGSCGDDHAALEQIEACSSVALALDELEAVDLTFGLAAARGFGQGGPTAVTLPSSPEANVAMAGASQAFALAIQVPNSAMALQPAVAVLPTPEARASAVKWRARSATALAVASRSTQATTATAAASRAEVDIQGRSRLNQ